MSQNFTKHHSQEVDIILAFLKDHELWRKHSNAFFGRKLFSCLPLSIARVRRTLDFLLKDQSSVIRDELVLICLKNKAIEEYDRQNDNKCFVMKTHYSKLECDFLDTLTQAQSLEEITDWISTIKEYPQPADQEAKRQINI